jgi:acetyltransferase-like isoleucine patch superfamily enzyme|tara:strand:- start:1124 stop:1621 length:498 start_codon:yes stop_codon:yes gene_type:complete
MKSNEKIFIHESAEVHNDSKIGPGTKIWINVQIRENASIGSDCIISKDVYIDESVTIGDRCKIQNAVSVYKGVSIADDVFVGPNACFTNDLVPRAFNQDWKITKTIVKEGASIGANATIICGVNIGKFSMIGAGAVVTRDVPDFSLVVGSPAKVIGKIDKNGNRV